MMKTIRDLFGLIEKKNKEKLPWVVVLMVIETMLQALGISLIVPLVTLILDAKTKTDHVVLCILALIIVYILKSVFMLVECRIRYDFICSARHEVQKKIFNSMMNRPYEYFLSIQSGEIIRLVSDDCNKTFNLLASVLDVFANSFLALGIIVVLLRINAKMMLAVALMLGLLSFALIVIVKPILRKQGQIVVKYATLNYKNLLETIQGIKIVKITDSKKYFAEEFRKNGEQVIAADRKNTVLNRIPTALTEIVCVCTILIYVLVLFLNGAEASDLVSSAGAFIVAALYLVPSVKTIINAFYVASFNKAALEKVVENYHLRENSLLVSEKNSEKPELKERIDFCNISFKYPGTEQKILNKASLTISVGKTVGIIGPSGIGKTTSADLLLGLLTPQEGYLAFDGKKIKICADNYPISIGYVPQNIFLLDDTIENNIAFGISEEEIDKEKIKKVIEMAQLQTFVDNLPDGMKTVIGENGIRLSGGQRQRIGIARALYRNPQLLIFDEATSALDLDTETSIMESIEKLRGKLTMLIITHRPQALKNCDEIFRLLDGKFVNERK